MRLRYTLPALADLDSILDYVADRSPQGARHIHARIRAVTELLLQYPLAGAGTDDPTIRRMTTRPYPYLIFYEATGGRNHHSCGAARRARPVRQYSIGVTPLRASGGAAEQNRSQRRTRTKPGRPSSDKVVRLPYVAQANWECDR